MGLPLRTALIIIIVASAASGCSLFDRECLVPLQVEELVGTWDWTRTYGGIYGGTFTPESEGRTAAIEFTSNCRLTTFRNGSIVETSRFTLRPKGQQDTLLVREDHYVNQTVSLRGSQLVLYDYCSDCFWHYYVRRVQP